MTYSQYTLGQHQDQVKENFF